MEDGWRRYLGSKGVSLSKQRRAIIAEPELRLPQPQHVPSRYNDLLEAKHSHIC